METKLIEYIVTIAKHKSISRAAEELYVTQSALNQQLLKLEKELDAPLFCRARNNWELTEIGKLYVENSERILQIKRETYDQIQDMSQKWKGTITIRLTPERGIQMFTAIYPKIHAKYPDTTFQPIEADVDSQVRLLDSNELDISFQTIYERKYKHLVYKEIFKEPFYLCIPKTHPLAYKEKLAPEHYPEISLTEFRNDLFTLVKKSSTMRVVIDRLFEESAFKPKLLFESTSMRTMQKLTENGQCCSIIPRCYAISSDGVSYYSLGQNASWELAAVYTKNHYITLAAKDFIYMASDYWTAHPYIE
ncbi:LysR family transcriptional regulator [Clostridium sp. Marseille-P2415]|uniref:LysR family transcriptional regulator n=1 Tax=Clostridium sp. Marseille-P2415 TaxID=1805471 RepID=UPI000988895F|nr:LysR family transcriptional regulator [Clostridium sp. Marseille-P2415]